jgi:hypothetical protein
MTTDLGKPEITLYRGGHDAPQPGTPVTECKACLMEAVVLFRFSRPDDAGIWRWRGSVADWTDHPDQVSPYLAGFGRVLNDRLDDVSRQQLLGLEPMLQDTAADGLDQRRRWMAADHCVRVLAPKWLSQAGLTGHATALRELPPIADGDSYRAAYPVVQAARDAAWQLRRQQLEAIRATVREALGDRPDAVADAAAVAAAAAVAVAVAVAAAAADAAAVAVAAADAAAVAVAAAAAAAAAAADAVADAAADAAADAVADAAADADAAAAAAADAAGEDDRYWAVRDAVYTKVRALYEGRYADLVAETRADAVALYKRLIRAEPSTDPADLQRLPEAEPAGGEHR